MWPRFIGIAAGLWLMAAPEVLDYGGDARTISYIIGPVGATFAAVAISEVTRPLRWVNALASVALIALPWVLGYPTGALWSSVASGIVLLAAALVRGKVHGKYGGGWTVLVAGDSPDGGEGGR